MDTSTDQIETGLARFTMSCIKASRFMIRYPGVSDLEKLQQALVELQQAVVDAEKLVESTKSTR